VEIQSDGFNSEERCLDHKKALKLMYKLPALLVFFTLAILAGLLINLNGCGGSSHTQSQSKVPGPHVMIIVQENRTPDNLFQDPVLISRGADIQSYGLDTSGNQIPLTQIDLGTSGANPDYYDVLHDHASFEDLYDGGKMDGENLVPLSCTGVPSNCPPNPVPPNYQYRYVNPADVQPYFAMAEQYTFGDRMFQTNEGPSFPAHQFIFSGTSAPTASSPLFASENIYPGTEAGCIAPPGSIVKLIDPAGVEGTTQYPCFEHQTMGDLLDAGGVSWRYYAPSAGSIWTAPDAIQHICQPQTVNGQLVCTGPDWVNNVSLPNSSTGLGGPAQVLADIASGQLPQVTWVIPTGQESDHAGLNDGSGPSWVSSVVNAVGNSPYWENMVIFITWDDWGAWYDHVPPPQVLVNCAQWGCGYVYGFRVPLIIVSSHAKTQYISHVNHDFGSILKFIEEQYGLSSLGYADAPADDFSDCFNFSQSPTPFQTIPAEKDANFFLHDKRPPTDPDDD
jgi:phospholipase C